MITEEERFLDFTYEIKNRTLVVRLEEEIDHHNAQKLIRKLDVLIELNNIRILIFDCAKTKFMDSSGIGVIMGRYKLMQSIGGQVGLVNVSSSVDRLLKLSGVYRIVKRYEGIQEALMQLS